MNVKGKVLLLLAKVRIPDDFGNAAILRALEENGDFKRWKYNKSWTFETQVFPLWRESDLKKWIKCFVSNIYKNEPCPGAIEIVARIEGGGEKRFEYVFKYARRNEDAGLFILWKRERKGEGEKREDPRKIISDSPNCFFIDDQETGERRYLEFVPLEKETITAMAIHRMAWECVDDV